MGLFVSADEATTIAKARFESQCAQGATASLRRALFGRKPALTGQVSSTWNDIVVLDSVSFAGLVPMFNLDPGFEDRFSKLSEVAAVREVSTYSMLSLTDQQRLRKVEKMYKLPRGLAVCWLSGKTTGNSDVLHPELSFLRDRFTSYYMRLAKEARALNAANSGYTMAQVSHAVGLQLQAEMRAIYSW